MAAGAAGGTLPPESPGGIGRARMTQLAPGRSEITTRQSTEREESISVSDSKWVRWTAAFQMQFGQKLIVNPAWTTFDS